MESIEPLRSKVSITLDLPPSCVQFCPAHPQYFVVGTYNLERGDEAARPDPEDETIQAENLEAKKPQSRNGSLVLFRTDGETMFVNNDTPCALLNSFGPLKSAF
jgi:diphthine methyl ester acylhydrolase